MKKAITKFLLVLSLFVSLGASAQGIPCTGTVCTPFTRTDDLQIYRAIKAVYDQLSAGTITASIGDTINVQDNSEDTLNSRLEVIKQAQFNSGVSTAEWLTNIDSKLNSAVNQLAVIEIYTDSIANRSTYNSKSQANYLSIISNSLNNLYNKIDTTTKIVKFTINMNATYSLTGVASIGTVAVKSLSINLGSNYWQLESLTTIDLGGNYGWNGQIMLLNDTISATNNVTITPTTARFNKVLGVYASNNELTINNSFGKVKYMTNPINAMNFDSYTGTVYFLPTVSTVPWSGSNQIFKIKAVFRKLNN